VKEFKFEFSHILYVLELGLFGVRSVQSEQQQKWSRMARNSAEQFADLSDAVLDKRDSQQITDLIEQLERDLKETRKNEAKER